MANNLPQKRKGTQLDPLILSDEEPNHNHNTTNKVSVKKEALNWSFSLKIKHGRSLKIALSAMCDEDLNPNGSGRLSVDPKEFRISCFNVKSKVHCMMRLEADKLEEFNLYSRFVDHMLDLRDIKNGLQHCHNLDAVFIKHVKDSKNLEIFCGDGMTRPTRISTQFLSLPPLPRFSMNILSASEAYIPCRDLISMTQFFVQNGRPQIVSVDMDSIVNVVTVAVGQNKAWKYHATWPVCRMEHGKAHHGWFYWPHLSTLCEACELHNFVTLLFFSGSEDHIVLKFSVEEFGSFAYIKPAIKILPNYTAAN